MTDRSYNAFGSGFKGYRLGGDEQRENSRMSESKRNKPGRDQLIASLVLVVILCATAALSVTLFFKLAEVAVENDSRYSDELIIETAELRQGTNLFLINRGQVARKICNELTYVKNVDIDIRLPSTIVIRTTPDKAEMAMELGGSYLLLSESARVLESSLVMPGNIPMIDGAELKNVEMGREAEFEDAGKIKTAQEIIKQAKKLGLEGKITEINVNDMYQVKLVYEGRINVELGTHTDMEYKIKLMKKAVSEIDEKGSGTLKIVDNKSFYKPNN